MLMLKINFKKYKKNIILIYFQTKNILKSNLYYILKQKIQKPQFIMW